MSGSNPSRRHALAHDSAFCVELVEGNRHYGSSRGEPKWPLRARHAAEKGTTSPTFTYEFFGPVDSGVPEAGAIVTTQNSLTTPVQFSFSNATAKAQYYGLAPSFIGLYQFNVVVPAAGVNSALPFSFTLGGTTGTQTLYIAVQNWGVIG